MTNQTMFYVAEPYDQPGTAFATLVADGKFPDEEARTLADWRARGATVRLVDGPTMRTMVRGWKRPKQNKLSGEK